MSSAVPLTKAGAGKFRARLLVAMMLVVFVITAAVLYFMQRRSETEVATRLEQEFRGQAAYLLGAQEARLAAITDRCRVLARSARIRAALEEDIVEDLYLNARVELRDILDSKSTGEESPALRAEFFRFLNAEGQLLSPPRAENEAGSDWEKQLVLNRVPEQQQIGYVVVPTDNQGTAVREIVATPIIASETGEILGAVVLGFKPVASRIRGEVPIKSGFWIGKLYGVTETELMTDALNEEVRRAMLESDPQGAGPVVTAGGSPHLLFHRVLNPGSRYPAAQEVCLYPLAESLARQQWTRWQIVSAGVVLLLAGLVASHFISAKFSAPIAKLVDASAEHLAQRERAEAALELSREELLVLNAELQAALSNLQDTQQQVIQQERLRALGQMASGIAHDFNNALVPILGFCELLLIAPDTLSDRPRAINYLETIQTAAKDASSVVSRLREFYRADKGIKAFAPMNLKRLVEQVVTLTRPRWKDQAQAKGATIQINLELDAVPPVAGEESALREVLTNLVFNAVDAMPHGGTLTLRTRCSKDSAKVEVADTGTGMTEEVRKRCLEPFFSTKGEHGTGLGLSMVFGIVKRHSGSLDLQSEPGKGTTFVITLPLMDAAPERASEAPATSKATRSLTILVVDDEAPVRDTLAAVLAADGHQIEVARDGAEGLKRFAAGKFDLVITDKAMPSMNGDQMAAAIKHLSPKTPIVLLTGFGLFHEKSEYPSVDVLASKPIRIPTLRDAITTAMQTA